MPTYIDGIGASENIDSSGERILMAGLDITSLTVDGIFNYEHKNDQPSQIVGKVLKAKKIFTDKDCEDDRQKYYWQKVQVPYLYVMGELFDDYKDSAKDVAGMFRYDAAKKGQNERNVMNFSVEGAKISKEGMDIVRSIARKITVTVLPCNKMAIAEMVPSTGTKQKDDMDGIFKTESMFEVELLKSGGVEISLIKARPMKKEIGMGLSSGGDSSLSGGAPTGTSGGMLMSEKNTKVKSKGRKIGATSTGVDIMSHGPAHEYGFKTPQEHTEAASAHEAAGKASKDVRWKTHHDNKAKIHARLSHGLETQARERTERANKLKTVPSSKSPVTGSDKKLYDPEKSGKITPPGPTKKSEEMNKAGGVGLDRETPKQPKAPAIKPQNINRPNAGFGRVIGMGIGGAGMGGMGAGGGGVGKSEEKGVHKPLFSKDKTATPGLKAGQGMSSMGYNVRHPSPTNVGHAKAKASHNLKQLKEMPKPNLTRSEKMKKGLDAGSGNAAPGGLGGGAVLGKEDMSGSMQKVGKPNKKSKWLQRAEQEYGKWSKREEFENYMAKRMPHLKKGEIRAIGQTICLSKSLKAEESLSKLNKESASQNYQHSWIAKKEQK
jgi:hypothetical protein